MRKLPNSPRPRNPVRAPISLGVGDKVFSEKIGVKSAFEGVIVETFISDDGTWFCHVLDDDGGLWHRDFHDLQLIEKGPRQ